MGESAIEGGHGCTSAGYACPPQDVVAVLREEPARVTAELDALRGAPEVELERACDTTTRYTLADMLTAMGGDQ